MLKPNFSSWALLIAILVLGAWLRFHGATRPLVGYFDGGRTALEARHLRTLSVSEHRFRPIDNPRPESFLAYMNHPPLVMFFFSAAMETLVSPTEFPVRSGSILFSSLTTLLFFVLVWKTVSFRAGLFTALIASLAPIGSYYGGTAFTYDVASLFFATALLTVIALTPSVIRSILLSVPLIVLGAFSDVHFHFLPFAAVLIYSINSGRSRFRLSVLCCIATLIALGLWLLYIYIASGDGFSPFRSGMTRTDYSKLLSFSFYQTIFTNLQIMMTPVGILVAILGGIGGLFWKSSFLMPLRANHFTSILGILLIFGIAPIVVFPAGAELHIYWVVSLFPFVALLSGATMSRLPLFISLALLVPLSMSALTQWSRMKVQNDYRAYVMGQEVSRMAPDELIYVDDNPNLLWYYVNNPIHNINGFKTPEEILPAASRDGVDFILTSGAYILPVDDKLLSSFAPIYEDGGYFIYMRRSRIEEFIKNETFSCVDRNHVAVPSFLPCIWKVNKNEIGLSPDSELLVHWEKSNNERKQIGGGPVSPRLIETLDGWYVAFLVFVDAEDRETGRLAIDLKSRGDTVRHLASHPLELTPRWPVFPKRWWDIFPRSDP